MLAHQRRTSWADAELTAWGKASLAGVQKVHSPVFQHPCATDEMVLFGVVGARLVMADKILVDMLV